jgi:hypothetical protein
MPNLPTLKKGAHEQRLDIIISRTLMDDPPLKDTHGRVPPRSIMLDLLTRSYARARPVPKNPKLLTM